MTFEHQGLLFHREERLHEVVGPWLRSAVSGGAHTVLVVGGHRSEALTAALTGAERSRVHVTERSRVFSAPGRTLALLHRLALSHAPGPVAVVAEPPLAEAPALERREWHRLESVLDTALSSLPVRMLCVHEAAGLPSGARAAVRATHPVLAAPGGSRSNPGYLGRAAFGALPDAPEPLPVTGPVHVREIGGPLPVLRRELTGLGRALSWPEERVDNLVTGVNELAANVLEHGAGKGTVTLWRGPGRWVCDVFDEEGGLDDPLAGYCPGDGVRSRGYGLWIARQTCDFMEICGGRTGSLVRLHLLDRLSGPAIARPRRCFRQSG
ncbi:anti-sigma factor RsbA family regulatory protein [Nocardiopsis sp. CNT312]|uniref:anti-sigma factor RsbA family regulatory protein n=1 Tax=Nocardiopsis sp. CNT312 TaxID=1137268 RepID=UPI000490A1F8|nr:anti-sigma factor RsbA family regulatory protein [Nocardiopsis sp. CNT312]